jgi:hypothetical protein
MRDVVVSIDATYAIAVYVVDIVALACYATHRHKHIPLAVVQVYKSVGARNAIVGKETVHAVVVLADTYFAFEIAAVALHIIHSVAKPFKLAHGVVAAAVANGLYISPEGVYMFLLATGSKA